MPLLRLIPLWVIGCSLWLVLTGCKEQALPVRSMDISCVEVGDILFRRGDSMASRGVLRVDQDGFYSHVGLAVLVDGRIMVAHAVPDEDAQEFTKLDSLEDFYAPSRAGSGAICRLPLDETHRQLLNTRALQLVAAKLPFDHDYDDANHDKLYCTEFVWLVYQVLALDLSCGQRKAVDFYFVSGNLILPSHLFKYPSLQLIDSF